MTEPRPRPSVDFADEVSGRAAERDATRADGWRLVLTIVAAVAIVGSFIGWRVAVAGLEPQAKREDRLTPSPLPAPYCRPTDIG